MPRPWLVRLDWGLTSHLGQPGPPPPSLGFLLTLLVPSHLTIPSGLLRSGHWGRGLRSLRVSRVGGSSYSSSKLGSFLGSGAVLGRQPSPTSDPLCSHGDLGDGVPGGLSEAGSVPYVAAAHARLWPTETSGCLLGRGAQEAVCCWRAWGWILNVHDDACLIAAVTWLPGLALGYEGAVTSLRTHRLRVRATLSTRLHAVVTWGM